MTHLALATVHLLRLLLARRDDHSAWSSPLGLRVFGKASMLPTGSDMLITPMIRDRAGKACSVVLVVAILHSRRRSVVPSAVHSLRSG